MSTLKFAETHNLFAFLDKPEESKGFEQIIDFLEAKFYQICANVQIQALVDGKKVIVTETSQNLPNMKEGRKGISGRSHLLFQAMMVQALEEVGEGLAVPTDSRHTTTQPSTSRP
ncbi:hypothetical protein Tco_1166789 [Tanacetum coccineum]